MARRSADRLSRRELLRASLGAAIGLWLVELGAGTLGFLWPSETLALAKVRVGTLKELIAANPVVPISSFRSISAGRTAQLDLTGGDRRRRTLGA